MILHTEDDLDLGKIAESGQCFRWENCGGDTWRILAGEKCLYVTALGGGRFDLECGEDAFEGFWKGYFDLREDYRAIRARIDPEMDPFLWRASEQEKGIRILRQDPWEMLITFIISQNRNIPAIKRSVELLAKACGEKKTDARGREYFAFPSPSALEALSAEDLNGCRLGYRCRYVHETAAAAARREIDLQKLLAAGEEETMAALMALPGVGIKVASCVSLFGLHHTDAFPVDVWMKRVLSEQYPGGYPFERYSPCNGVFQQYMFAFYRNENGGKTAEMSKAR